jgi:hypothetical protein
LKRFALSGLLLAGLFAAPIAIAKSVTFDVANHTGATLTAVYTGPTGVDEWGENILDGQVANNGVVTVTLDGITGCAYDFRYEFTGKKTFEEFEIDICKIDGAQFEIK